MNREMYEQIEEQIKAEFDEKMVALGILAGNANVFNPKTPLKSTPPAPASRPSPEMKVLREIPANGVSANPDAGRYIKKLVPCEFKGCDRNGSPGRKCPACSKSVCSKHLRGKVCVECNQLGEN